MSDAKTYYRDLILTQSKDTRHCGVLAGADRRATRHNALCGDTITVHLRTREGVVEQLTFEGHSCAIARAVASLMAGRVHGKAVGEVLAWASRAEAATYGQDDLPFAELQGIVDLPARRRCATLPWEAVAAALLEHDRQ